MDKSKKEVLARISPSLEEKKKLNDIAEAMLSKIKIKNALPTLGGSVAKNTWLKGNHDIDIYVKFDPKYYEGKDISKILKQSLKNIKKKDKVHGSRDYFQIMQDTYTIELVPILDIKKVSQAINITDVSPFHVKWVKKHKSLCDEMRLTKAFCKANKIYGAESYIKGFSGYVLEILTVYYESFNKLIKAVSKWDSNLIIDIEKHYKEKNIIKELNQSKTKSPLILIDPVQKERNASAGLSKEKFKLFKELAKAYLKNPSPIFFIKKEITINNIKELANGKQLILIEATPLKGKKDVVGAKLLKCFEHFSKHLKLNNFILIDQGWDWTETALFYFILDKKKLPQKKKHYGPPKNSTSLNDFKNKWKNYNLKFEKNISYIIMDRNYRDAKSFMKDFIKKDYIKERVKSIKLI
jgi:tRNA nucleotidyltransferase (CCA-adding enzyme)